MESTECYGNVHTGLRQGQGPESIVLHCATSIPCTSPGPISVQCDHTTIWKFRDMCFRLTFSWIATFGIYDIFVFQSKLGNLFAFLLYHVVSTQ